MCFSFFPTLVNDYIFVNNDTSKWINLKGQKIIVDGYSFFYYMYYEAQIEDQDKCMVERKTISQFSYDGLWEKFQDRLKRLKEHCEEVLVVLDGVFHRHERRRSEPERESSVKFNHSSNGIPTLLREELRSVLKSLDIDVFVAPGEADPMIVRMAREHHAYILARDSDYHLYELPTGYIPLPTLDFSTLQGKYYQMKDVFQKLTQRCVALWATTIAYDFISLDDLEKYFSINNDLPDAKKFRRWLDDSQSDDEKRQRLTCQFGLLRYIQDVDESVAFKKIISLVLPQDQLEFEQIMKSYTESPPPTPLVTYNSNEFPQFLEELYINGQLDYAIVRILSHREILRGWRGNHSTHLNLLIPMCYMLLKWDNSFLKDHNIHSWIVTFHGKTYNLLEYIQNDDLVSLDDFICYEEKKRRTFLLSCVDFALGSSLNWHKVHRDYKIWCSLIKLWLKTQTTKSNILEATLIALIVSFLKYSLLDTYDETKDRLEIDATSLDKPYQQYSYSKLKNHFSREKCFELRKKIRKYANVYVPNEIIDKELNECEQFYKELSIINQFSKQPFDMPPPHSCFNISTTRLAVRLSQSKKIWKDVKSFCSDKDPFLFDFIEELYKFVSVGSILTFE
ncbi:unnamed protein product [Adineta ricciae]|uniref:Asteroid domain-containing protein n=1 Tax=Adineta ricciae TaxID=249248 RepID=A0A815HPG0_ADIRI|nr:unnamed protein product [Adineta ricciae]CAF1579438.1 unnamed protein product [Adineta ricciae]